MSSHCSHKFTWTLAAPWLHQWLEIYGYHGESLAFLSICFLHYSFFSLWFLTFSPPLFVFFPLVISPLPVAMAYDSQSERYRRGLIVFQSCYSGPASPTPHPPEDETNGEQGQHLEHSLRGLLAEDWEVGGEWFGTLSKAIKYLISWDLRCFLTTE